MCDFLLLRDISTGIPERPIHETSSSSLANDFWNVGAVSELLALLDVSKVRDHHGNILLVLS